MSQLIKILSTITIILSLLISNLNFSLNLKLEAKNSEQLTSKKILKKKLSLDYTHPKFETDLNQDQKTAILKSLKKWKGELPIDNKFTVTSIVDLKSETNDDSKVFKKKNKDTADALVVYMWAQTPNPEYDPNHKDEHESHEEGDPRFIRTQFNILLKQSKNSSWKASLERDPEVQVESLDILESDIDGQIYKDLFATDNADNGFTATEEVLIEDANTISESSTKSMNTKVISSSLLSQITAISSQVVPTISPVETNPLPVSKEKTSWLQNIFSFGSISAIAQVTQQYNYSWPWKGGDTWAATQGWHNCETYYGSNSTQLGCSLDMVPVGNSVSKDVLAPITTTIIRSCLDKYQGEYQFGNMSILHLSANSMINNTGAFVRKSTKIGEMFDPNSVPKYTFSLNDGGWVPFPDRFKTNCGTTSGAHIHVKLSAITNPTPNHTESNGSVTSENMQYQNLIGTTTIDGVTLQGAKYVPLRIDNKQNYNTNPTNPQQSTLAIVSQNYSNTNTYTGKIKSFTTPNKIFDIYDFNGNNGATVQLYEAGTNNPVNQRWSYNSSTNQIKGMNGRCLAFDYLNTANNQITMEDCNNYGGQTWYLRDDNSIQSASYILLPGSIPKCMGVASVANSSLIKALNCNSSNTQKWDFSSVYSPPTPQLNLKVNLAGPWNSTTKTMGTNLRANVLPLTQPYNAAPWNYTGTESIPNRSSINANAVDWVLVEIKNTSGITVQRKAALLLKDGTVVDANTGTYLTLGSSITDAYYKIIVRHRNHIAIATENNIYLSQFSVANLDLTKNVNVKGLNQLLLGNVNGVNVYGMRNGNVNGDRGIDALDRSIVDSSTESSGVYDKVDINFDTEVDAIDRSIIQNVAEAVEFL